MLADPEARGAVPSRHPAKRRLRPPVPVRSRRGRDRCGIRPRARPRSGPERPASPRLRATPVPEILAAQAAIGRANAQFGETMPPFPPVAAHPGDPAEGAAGKQILIGATREECHAFFAADPAMAWPDPAQVAARFEALTGRADGMAPYRARRPGGSLMDWLADLVTDHTFVWPAMRLAGAHGGARRHGAGLPVRLGGAGIAVPGVPLHRAAIHVRQSRCLARRGDARWRRPGGDGGRCRRGCARPGSASCRTGTAGEDWPAYDAGGAVDDAARAGDGAGARSGRAALARRGMTAQASACSAACRMPGPIAFGAPEPVAVGQLTRRDPGRADRASAGQPAARGDGRFRHGAGRGLPQPDDLRARGPDPRERSVR